MTLPLNKKITGSSFIETIIVIAIASILIVALVVLFSRLINVNKSDVEQVRMTEDGRLQMDRIQSVIRNSHDVILSDSTQLPWLKSGQDYSMQIYTSIEGSDQKTELIRYFIDTTNTTWLQRGITKQVGDTFPTETIDVLAKSMANRSQATPLFKYFDSLGNVLPTPLSGTDLPKVVRIGINMVVDVNPNQAPGPNSIYTEVTIRIGAVPTPPLTTLLGAVDSPTGLTFSTTGVGGNAINTMSSSVIDRIAGYAYFGTWTTPAKVTKIRLSDFTRVGDVTLNSGEDLLNAAVIDTTAGYAYFGTGDSPAKVVKIRLSDFTEVGAITLNAGENNIHSAVIDTAGGYAYFGTGDSPAKVVKVQLSTFTRIGVITLNSGENLLYSAVIDPAAGYAYFGTHTDTGIVVKIQLSTFTRVGALILSTGQSYLDTAVIDTAAGFAYFSTDFVSAASMVLKIKLSNFTLATIAYPTAKYFAGAVIDPAGGYIYLGNINNPANIDKIRLSDFTQVGEITLSTMTQELTNAVIDATAGFAYFGSFSSPARVVKTQLSDLSSTVLILDAVNPLWFAETSVYKYGGSAMQSAVLTDNQSTSFKATASKSGTLSFYWKVSSELNYDLLTFYINGVQKAVISGEVDWTQSSSYTVNSGDTLEWKYSKDASGSNGADAGWVDDVSF